MASYKILVFNRRRYHFIHRFIPNLSQSFRKDLTFGLILKHEQAKKTQKVFLFEDYRKTTNFSNYLSFNPLVTPLKNGHF